MTEDLGRRISRLSPEKQKLLELRSQQRLALRPAQTIPRRAQSNARLSSGQERFWFLDQLHPGSWANNVPSGLRLTGFLDVVALARAFSEIVRRHEVLRTSFPAVGGAPVQCVAPARSLEIPMDDLGSVPKHNRLREARQIAIGDARQPFDLARGPLLRLRLLRLSDADHILLFTLHHIVIDGWSLSILAGELASVYGAYCAGRPSPLHELPVQYGDYAEWQRARLVGDFLEPQRAYWIRRLEGAPPVLELPVDHARPAVASFRGGRRFALLSEALSDGLKALARREGSTLYMTLLAAFQVLLHRYTGRETIVVGTPVSGRARTEFEALVGCFINMLAMRADMDECLPFRELLARVRQGAVEAYQHQELPFESLVEGLHPIRDLRHAPIFQVTFQLRNFPRAHTRFAELRASDFEFDTGSAKFDLGLEIEERVGRLHCRLEYAADLFDSDTVERMLEHFEVLLESIVADPDRPVGALRLLTDSESRRWRSEHRFPRRVDPQGSCIHRLFEEQVERSPDAIAVVFQDRRLTYRELNQSANQLAHHLQKYGVGSEARVGVHMDRSLEMIVGVLGILKAGGAYLPLDRASPAPRLAATLADAGARVVVTDDALAASLPPGCAVIRMDRDWPIVARESSVNPVGFAAAENLAYVIYTSGSTGAPKGVMVEHRSVVDLAEGLYQAVYARRERGGLQVGLNGPLASDTSVKQLVQLLFGHTLHVLPEDLRRDPEAFAAYLEHRELDVVDCTPSQLRFLLPSLPAGGRDRGVEILVGGEAIDESLWNRLVQCDAARFYNMYGPTECTVDSTIASIEHAAGLPTIGRPLANTDVYVLDGRRSPVPQGVAGELYIGGAGLARGYLGRPELTARAFVAHPFDAEPGARLYRTGDRVRSRSDGQLEFLGRCDDQVKIHGFRVEPGEIEAILNRHPRVERAVVASRAEGPGTVRLSAYVTLRGPAPLTSADLRQFLERQLPAHMIPAAYTVLEEFPVTAGGKLDRDALLRVRRRDFDDEEAGASDPARALTPDETALARIWADVLGVETVNPGDNFFALGGDSLQAIRAVAKANQAGLKLTPRQLFEHQTIAELSLAVGSARTSNAEQGPVTGPLPLTPIQCRFFDLDLPEPHHYNQAFLFEIPSTTDTDALNHAIRCVAAHHDSLRLRFSRAAEGWNQVMEAPDDGDLLTRIDLERVRPERQAAAARSAAAELQRSLDLGKGPLARVARFSLGAKRADHLLVIVHHLAIDGVSWPILMEDLWATYQQATSGKPILLPSKTTSFKEWAERLASFGLSEPASSALAYWRENPRVPVDGLPVDDPEGSNRQGDVGRVTVSFDAEETGKVLRQVCAFHGVSVAEVLLAALARSFEPWTGSRSLLVDVQGHGRQDLFQDVDLTRTIGWFSTLHPVTVVLPESGASGRDLHAVREQLRAVPANGIGYGVLRYLSRDAAATSRLQGFPQAQVSFNYLGSFHVAAPQHSPWRRLESGAGEPRSERAERSHLIDVRAALEGGKLSVSWAFSERVHRRTTLANLAKDFAKALRVILRESSGLRKNREP